MTVTASVQYFTFILCLLYKTEIFSKWNTAETASHHSIRVPLHKNKIHIIKNTVYLGGANKVLYIYRALKAACSYIFAIILKHLQRLVFTSVLKGYFYRNINLGRVGGSTAAHAVPAAPSPSRWHSTALRHFWNIPSEENSKTTLGKAFGR